MNKWDLNILKGIENSLEEKLEAAGAFIEAEAKKNCPVKTGALKSSISHKTTGKTLTVKAEDKKAFFVEAGTSKSKPQPFLRPALYGNINRIKEILTK